MASKRVRRTKSFQSYVAGVTSDLSTVKNRNVSTSIAARAIDGGAFSEEVEIVDKSLQSSNYLEGEDGWKIDGSGNAEFGNVYVRGDINAETGTIGYWNISTPAVTRTFGGTKLYGTFLESSDLGYSDTEVDTGTYVSLFKSFVGNPIVFESVNLTSDIVTVTSTGHYLLVGDRITTFYDDAALEANLSSDTYVTITGITEDTFSYEKPVADNYDGLNDVATTAISGYGEIYNEDISGLYLRDYAKNLFDYAYISNKGMAYVGASKLNLVYNPDFEYYDTSTSTLTSSSDSWTYNNTALGLWNFSTSPGYQNYSKYGGYSSWVITTLSLPIIGTVGYSEGVEYNIFSNSRPLYLSFDTHLTYTPYSATYSSVSSITSANVTITTTTAHGFSVGDLIYIDVNLEYDDGGANNFRYSYNSDYNIDKIFAVKGVPAYNQIVIENTTLGTNSINQPTATESSGSKGLKIYKTIWPAVDLSEVSFGFSNNASTVSLYNVLNVDSKAYWDASANNKYSVASAYNWMQEYLLYDMDLTVRTGRSSMTTTERLVVDSALLDSYYESLQPDARANSTAITLRLPAKAYVQSIEAANTTPTYSSTTAARMSSTATITYAVGSGTVVTYTANNNFAVNDRVVVSGMSPSSYNQSNAAVASANATHFTVSSTATGTITAAGSATAYKRVYIIYDAVSLSTESNFFYGGLTEDYSWYDPTLNSPSQVSVQAPKKWIDIDLDNQTGSITNMDYISLKSSRFTKSLISQPSISTKSDYSRNIMYTPDSSDYEYLQISSGQFLYISPDSTNTGGSYRNHSYSNGIVGDSDSAYEMVATREEINPLTGNVTTTYLSGLAVHVGSDYVSTVESRSDSFIVKDADGFEGGGLLRVTQIKAGVTGGSVLSFGDASDIVNIEGSSLTIDSNVTILNTYVQNPLYIGSNMSLTSPSLNTLTGVTLHNDGYGILFRDHATTVNAALFVGKINYTGTSATNLIDFRINGTSVGSITASGTGGATVSYNAFMGSHYTEFAGDAPLLGTVMETASGLVENKLSGQNRLPKTKVSDTPGSKAVYGVYFSEDADEDSASGHMIAALGASWIRIAPGLTVVAGDLLESNGDGCARVQADDLIRSSTIGKVTSPEAVTTYEDGSYLVPCVLYCG